MRRVLFYCLPLSLTISGRSRHTAQPKFQGHKEDLR